MIFSPNLITQLLSSNPRKMRPDRSAAQVLLILYAVSVVLAAPAGVSERYRDALAAQDVRAREDPNAATTAPKTAPPVEEDPDDKLFLNKVLRTKIYRYVILGTIAGTFSGVMYSVQKDLYGSIAPGAYVSLHIYFIATFLTCHHPQFDRW